MAENFKNEEITPQGTYSAKNCPTHILKRAAYLIAEAAIKHVILRPSLKVLVRNYQQQHLSQQQGLKAQWKVFKSSGDNLSPDWNGLIMGCYCQLFIITQ